MRIFGLNRRIVRVLLGSQYAHMLEYRAEIALWAPVSYTHLTLPTICSV